MNEDVTRETSIAERFRAIAASMPESAALVSVRARHTFAELDRWSDAVARAIAVAGASREVPVAIIVRDHVSLVPAVLGIIKAGHFFVAIDAGDPAERIASILAASGAELAVVDGAPAPAGPLRTIELPSATRAVELPVRDTPLPGSPPNELVQLVFTSGSTGIPKGVATRQRAFVERSVRASQRTGRGAGERVSYTALPGFARAGSEIFGSLLNGGTLCAFDARTENLDALAEMIERERISTLTLTPALFRRLMRTLPPTTDLSSVRKLRIGADVMTPADVDAWRARFPPTTTLERGFAATETGMVLHISITHDTAIDGPLVPMGRPVPGVDVWVQDEQGHDVAEGEIGELVVRSTSVAPGYWNAPDLTAEKFAFDPERPDSRTFRTGDLVRRGDDGLYYFIGRRDSRLKIHGRRIDPLEIEHALIAHAGAREAAVVARIEKDGEARLTAYVVMRDAAVATEREIRATLREHIASWLIPSRVHLVEALPITGAGKVDRQLLASQVEPEPADDGAQPAAASDVESTLLSIWSRILGTTVRVHDDFFDDLGGESLMAAEIITEVNRLSGRSMPLSLMLELNTVAKMADYVRTSTDLSRTVIALQGEGSFPPLFCVAGKGGSVIVFRRLAALLGTDAPFFGLTHHGLDPAALPRTLAALAACYADAIRATQPAGPYYLAGYSAGGCIAYAIARQMALAGDELAFVGLIDSAASRDRLSAWRRYTNRYIPAIRRRPLAAAKRYSRAIGRRIVWLAAWLRSRGTQPFVPRPPEEIRQLNAYFDTLELQRALQPYDGAVTLFLARQGRGADSAHADAGWGALCESLEIVEIDGEHDTILNYDVDLLADVFRRALTTARARSLG